MIKRVEFRVERVGEEYKKYFEVFTLKEHEEENKKFETPKMYQGFTQTENGDKINRRVYKNRLGKIEKPFPLTSVLGLEDEQSFLCYYCYVEKEENVDSTKETMESMFKEEVNEILTSITKMAEA